MVWDGGIESDVRGWEVSAGEGGAVGFTGVRLRSARDCQ